MDEILFSLQPNLNQNTCNPSNDSNYDPKMAIKKIKAR